MKNKSKQNALEIAKKNLELSFGKSGIKASLLIFSKVPF